MYKYVAMDVTFATWVPEHLTDAQLQRFMEGLLYEGVAPYADLMQRAVDRAFGTELTRVERRFHCVYPRGPIRLGAPTGLRQHRYIAPVVIRHTASASRPAHDFRPFACGVCLETCDSALDQQILPCTHRFHKECVRRWVAQTGLNATCPECRHRIFA